MFAQSDVQVRRSLKQ